MGHERIKQIKENLMACIEAQMCNIYEVDAEELGEAIDMLKDLEEALYYCTITEAMEGKKQGNEYEFEMKNGGKESSQMYNRGSYYPMYARDMDDRGGRGDGNESRSGGNRPSRSYERMYEEEMSYARGGEGQSYARGGGGGQGGGGSSSGGGSSGGSGSGGQGGGGSSSSNFSEMMMRDPREGRSPESRRMYLQSKQSGSDKASQLRELEKYMQELSQDVVDMIQEASPEEKQYLEKKISALASKIGQMK